jgi:serine phosphatase RsbU (regulator of sigma subunit)
MDPLDDERFEATTIASREQLAAALRRLDDAAHYLIVTGASGRGRRVEIGVTAPVTVGRDSRHVLTFNDTDLSRSHLRVSLERGRARVEDMGSTNGTFVNEHRITSVHELADGDRIRAGRQILRYERRNRHEAERAIELERELEEARGYLCALLPPPLAGGLVRVDWCFVPSTQLGGDGFGYAWLDETTFVFYLIDVSGHGVGAAMHASTVLNLLRQRMLPDVDFTDPSDVLGSLNARFQMDSHGGMFFTIWYGVYRTTNRTLTCSTAGHHPAFMVTPDRAAAQPLGRPAFMIGAMERVAYENQQVVVPRDGTIYLFSDGVFEIEPAPGEMWGLRDFLPLLLEQPLSDVSEPDRLRRAVTATSRRDPLPDDFSLLTVTCS